METRKCSRNFKRTVYLDVRTKDEFELGSIPGAINIPIDDLRDNLHLLNKSNTIVAFCAVGLRGYLAARILMQNGFENVFNLNGGYKTWEYAVKKQSNEDIYKIWWLKKMTIFIKLKINLLPFLVETS